MANGQTGGTPESQSKKSSLKPPWSGHPVQSHRHFPASFKPCLPCPLPGIVRGKSSFYASSPRKMIRYGHLGESDATRVHGSRSWGGFVKKVSLRAKFSACEDFQSF